jgi:multisubunit Na+/H+ antiporter MnhB subunit
MGCFLSQAVAVAVSAVVLVAVMRWRHGRGWTEGRGLLIYYACALPFGVFVVAVPPCRWL